MPSVAKDTEKALLALPAVERACIAGKLLSSLDLPAQSEIDFAWAKEAEDRVAAFEQRDLKASEDTKVYECLEKKYGI